MSDFYVSLCFPPSQEENEKLIVRWKHVTSKYFYNFTRFRHFITFRMFALKLFFANFFPFPSSKSSKMCSAGCKKDFQQRCMEMLSLHVTELILQISFYDLLRADFSALRVRCDGPNAEHVNRRGKFASFPCFW